MPGKIWVLSGIFVFETGRFGGPLRLICSTRLFQLARQADADRIGCLIATQRHAIGGADLWLG